MRKALEGSRQLDIATEYGILRGAGDAAQRASFRSDRSFQLTASTGHELE